MITPGFSSPLALRGPIAPIDVAKAEIFQEGGALAAFSRLRREAPISGYGIHACAGARLGELQVRILWEEMLKRDARFVLTGPPERTASTFVNGYNAVPVSLSFD